MVFSTYILRYVESKFTLLKSWDLMENNTVITVISYIATEQQKIDQVGGSVAVLTRR